MKKRNKNIVKKNLTRLYILALSFGPLYAQANQSPTVNLPNPLAQTSIAGLISDVFTKLQTIIAPPIAVLMLIIGAIQLMTAGGNPEKVKKGKNTIMYTAIGFGVVLLASLIARLVKEILGAP